MPDIQGVNNRIPARLPEQEPPQKPAVQTGQLSPLEKAADGPRVLPTQGPLATEMPIGPPGPLGQPTGLPGPVLPGRLMPDAITGRDPSQLLAAEQLRTSGGETLIDSLLGLNLRPTMAGTLLPPPGNLDFLRHMSTALRRATVRELLRKQRAHMLRLMRLVSSERDGEDDDEWSDSESNQSEFAEARSDHDREKRQVAAAARMLQLIEELLAMQDYTFSRMGTFSKG